MTIQPYDAFRYYMAIKLHFESKTYCALKYNFKSSATPNSFFKRKDKYYFAKVAKKFTEVQDMINYYVSNFTHDKKWVGEMLESGDDIYTSWKAYHESLRYRFGEDLDVLVNFCDANNCKFDNLFAVSNGGYPPIIQLLLQEDIRLETVIILDKMLGFVKRLDKTVTDTIIWPDLSEKIKKAESFVSVDLTPLRKMVVKKFA